MDCNKLTTKYTNELTILITISNIIMKIIAKYMDIASMK